MVRGIATGPNVVAVGGGWWPFPVPTDPGISAGFVVVCDSAGNRISPILKHDSTVWAIDISPDEHEQLVVTGEDSGAVRCCRMTENGNEMIWEVPRAHKDRVYAVVFEPVTGKVVVTCGKDNKVNVRDAASGQLLDTQDLPDIGLSAVFTPDGSHFLAGYAGGSRVFRWADGKALPVGADLPHQAGVLFVSVDAKGRTALTGGTDRRVRWWDLKTGKPIGPGWPTDGLVRAARFTEAGKVLVADTKLTRGGFRTFELPQEATAPSAVLSDWVHHVSGIKVVNGVAEVIPVADMIELGVVPGTDLPVEHEISLVRNQQRRKVPAVALAPVPRPERRPVVEPPRPPDPKPPADPKPPEAAEGGAIW
jgi:hypothetical protein